MRVEIEDVGGDADDAILRVALQMFDDVDDLARRIRVRQLALECHRRRKQVEGNLFFFDRRTGTRGCHLIGHGSELSEGLDDTAQQIRFQVGTKVAQELQLGPDIVARNAST